MSLGVHPFFAGDFSRALPASALSYGTARSATKIPKNWIANGFSNQNMGIHWGLMDGDIIGNWGYNLI